MNVSRHSPLALPFEVPPYPSGQTPRCVPPPEKSWIGGLVPVGDPKPRSWGSHAPGPDPVGTPVSSGLAQQVGTVLKVTGRP